jgi:hypothetical protein
MLTKAYPIRLTLAQEKALNILHKKGFKKSQFIRVAISEKLKSDYRKILKELDKKEYCPF